jgi:excisionase family DNA binding protein
MDAIELLDIREAAQFLSVSETSLRRWTNAGILPCLRIGRRRERRFRRADLLAFMEQPAVVRDQNWRDDPMGLQELSAEPVAAIQGNHLCGIYGTDAGRLDLAVPFLLEGLEKNQKTPAAQCRYFEIAMKKAEDEGAESFRVVGDMWGLRLLVSASEMVELELGFESLIVPKFPVVALCAYDARKFTGIELLEALKDHADTFKFPMTTLAD